MLTTRPQPRSHIPGRSAWISTMGASMLASRAFWKSSRAQSRHCPGGGPPALVTRMSTSPAAASTARLPLRGRHVRRDRRDLHAMRRPERLRRRLQRLRPPRAITQVHPRLRQRLRAAAPEPLRRPRHQRPPPAIPRSMPISLASIHHSAAGCGNASAPLCEVAMTNRPTLPPEIAAAGPSRSSRTPTPARPR